MAWFTVQYRGPGGKTESVQIEAADRAGVFAELKKRGISPIRIGKGNVKKLRGQSRLGINNGMMSRRFMLILGFVVGVLSIFLIIFVAPVSTDELEKRPVTGLHQTTNSVDESIARIDKDNKENDPPPLETFVDERGIERYKGGLRVRNHKIKKEVVRIGLGADGRPLSNLPKFKYRCEDEIARLITLRPGATLVGMRRYDDRYKQDFVNALLEKNAPTAEDSPRDAEIKLQVDAVKKELAQRIKNGEDLGVIMTEARKEMQKYASIKREIEKEVREILKGDGVSDADVEIAFNAANILLESKGISPIKRSLFFDGALKIDATNNKEESK